jgi:site-specific recombinase
MFTGAPSSVDVAREMQDLAAALDQLDLPETLRYATRRDVERVGRELTRANPDRRFVADLARRTVIALDLGGALVADSPVLGSLHALERWLRTAGRPLAGALPA